ncbi:MAG: peptidylprolyl isomerase [Crocinitomicaceae bacterium]|jgi:FKBP-type peptidyl-prolyl cis-trans isomerase SlyD|nr:peptidylprolyl isomerase [Crocinitomicaceae bacterium]MBT5403079.1 peptidylprolyl isomerase [Crocinitomicaceae bacterium]MBT6030450.1 peptidylprolyl isomerase [Crocinitomicaceae bacterium]MBT6515913.1 peptidylprolyl isomerase [Crocinitomicaceae bacterium]MDG2332189.1 peptidylprolyl isomerase [Flavobacteriales bacterium]
MEISQDTVVTMHYVLKNDNGDIIDQSTEERGPLSILQGHGNIIPGLEEELLGKSKGDTFATVISPEHGYGEYQDTMVQIVPLSGFRSEDENEQVQEGMQVQVETNQGPAVAIVTKIEEEDVTLDLNHPLAGETLHFEIEVVEVRSAEENEIEHGHAHGPHGHSH